MKAILFDFDGTIVDTVDLIVANWQHATETHLGYRIEREKVLPSIGLSLLAALEDAAPGRGQQLFDTYQEHNMQWHDQLAKLIPGTTEMLAALKERGLKLGVVTAKRHSTLAMGLRLFDLSSYFDVLVGLEDTTRHKPLPDPVLNGLERLGIAPTPENAAFVGDAASDIKAGKAANVTTIAVPWGAGSREDLQIADALIERWDDLLRLVDERNE